MRSKLTWHFISFDQNDIFWKTFGFHPQDLSKTDPIEHDSIHFSHWPLEVKKVIFPLLTHWGWVTHICVSKLTIIGSHNGLSPGRRQAIIWTNAGILLIRPLGTNFNEMLIKIHTFSVKKMHLKMSSVKWWPFCHGLNVLTHQYHECFLGTCSCVNDTKAIWRWANIGSGNGLAPSHYLNQCLPRSMPPYGIIRPQWINP